MTTESSNPNGYVATLVCNPETPILEEAVVHAALATLPEAAGWRWLSEGVAADLDFVGPRDLDPKMIGARIRSVLAHDAIDIIVQPAAGRRKHLLLADMDSTMIGQECIDELADFAGFKTEVSAITERAMNGEIAFEPALRERVALLRGLPVGIVDDIMRDRLTLTPGGTTLIRTMRAHGAYTCLVSGGFTLFTSMIAKMIGFDEHRANGLLVENDTLTGEVKEPILGREAKRATLQELREAHGLDPSQTMAVGDGANDLAMLGDAGLGYAYRAKAAVAAIADVEITHGDLTALLYAQGYRREEFVAT